MKIIEIVTNNLANAQNTGFKRDFGRILESQQVLEVGTTVDTTPGDLTFTETVHSMPPSPERILCHSDS